MFMLNKGMQKLIASGIALLITLTTMFVAVFAILSTEKVGLSVNVSFDSAVTAKVYLATDSSTAGEFYQDSPTVNTGTGTDFVIGNSALVLDTKDGGTLQKTAFQALGTGNGLKCDASAKMEFYVYVENYSTTENIYYRANIDFIGTGEQTAPFSTVTNPNYETAETGEEGAPFLSLLTFKIKSTYETGLNANAIEIEINLRTAPAVSWLIAGPYTTGNYTGLYYIDYGEYPQSLQGATLPNPAGTNQNPTTLYYEDSITGLKYSLKSGNYYLVEPVRWLIIGNGSGLNDKGFPNKNFDMLGQNQLLLLSEKAILQAQYNATTYNHLSWMNSAVYNKLINYRNILFNESESTLLGTFNHDYSQLSLLSYDTSYNYLNYCPNIESNPNPVLITQTTNYFSSVWYWFAMNLTINGSYGEQCAYSVTCANGVNKLLYLHNTINLRPIIILNI
ncbi:MAG: hypothetical protein PHR96_02475 [Clostridia bacterium]|nr:hypothetical protein [Clostridia bacterium]